MVFHVPLVPFGERRFYNDDRIKRDKHLVFEHDRYKSFKEGENRWTGLSHNF